MKNLTAIRITPLTIALQIFALYSLFAQTTQEGYVDYVREDECPSENITYLMHK